MKKLLAVFALSLSLSGCVAFQAVDLLFRVAQTMDSRPPMKFDAAHDIPPTEGQRVYAADLSPSPLAGNKNCSAKALIVDYARDWDLVDEQTGDIVRKAEPEKIYSQAILVYRLICKDKPEESVLMATDRSAVLIYRSWKIKKEQVVSARDYFGSSDSRKPRWMAQVIKTIQDEAATNPAAQEFLAHVKIKDGMPISPETSKTEDAETERAESISAPDES